MVIPCLSLFACIRGEIVRVPYRRQGAALRFANAVPPQTLLGAITTNWNLSGRGPSILLTQDRSVA